MSIVAKNVLIYRLGSLGDTVIALPCFHKIKERFPDASITLLTNRPVAAKAAPIEAVLGKTYFFDNVLDYPIGTRNPIILATLIKQIRSLNIDTVVNLAAVRSKISNTRDRWFFQVAGIEQLIGFPSIKADFELSIDPITNEFEWEAKRLARRIDVLGAISFQNDQYWNLMLTESEYSVAENLIESSTDPIFAVCVGTKMQSKDWGIDNWINLITRIKMMLNGWRLVIIGAHEESDLAEICIRAWGGKSLNLCGKISPRVSAAVLQKARVFVGHDSGPMHLAACVGTPCVAIFSARNLPRQWYPRGEFNQILYHKTECAGCNLDVCIEQKKKCILSIGVDEVVQAVMKIVN